MEVSSYNRKQQDRIRHRRRTPDFMRKAGPMADKEVSEREEIDQQLDEWESEREQAEKAERERVQIALCEEDDEFWYL